MTKPQPVPKFSLSLRDAIWIGSLLVSIGIQWAQNSATKSDLANFQMKYEREVVPRGEHIEMNKVTDERFASIQAQLIDIKAELAKIESKQH